MNVEVKAAKTLLREGVALNIKPPLFLWLWKPKIYQPSCSQLVLMSKYLSETGISDNELENPTIAESTGLLAKHLETFCRMLAICMFRNFYLSKALHKIIANG
ncbi:hypothetical protein ACFFJX_27600 [Pseudarcicella hirudinis]|uniref:hypothetical protein n=1 Tax=Pseudarcicella hirudinis TaxID=1079859 RepID=UPI0035EC0563